MCSVFSKLFRFDAGSLLAFASVYWLSPFVCCPFVARWAADSTSSANRDTYCRALPPGSVCQISPGPASSPPASVSACSSCSLAVSLYHFFSHFVLWHLVTAYLHCWLLRHFLFFSSTLSLPLAWCLLPIQLVSFAQSWHKCWPPSRLQVMTQSTRHPSHSEREREVLIVITATLIELSLHSTNDKLGCAVYLSYEI